MEKHYKFSIWYVLIGIWVVLLAQNIISTMMAVKTIPYSQFLNLLKAGQVTEVAITENQIQGKYKEKDGSTQAFKAVRVDPEISRMLDEYKVTFKGQIEQTFFRDLLSWVLPIVIFIGVWYFLMKRMAGQQPGFMSLGKNKARIYMERELKVRFPAVAGVDEAEQELVEVIDFRRTPTVRRAGGKNSQGHPPWWSAGHGQDPAAKAVAGESGVPFFSMRGPTSWKCRGLGAARVRDLFTQPREGALHHLHRRARRPGKARASAA